MTFSCLVIASAWSQEDAYITLRTVDNVLNGFGLRWNPAERVQSYTHPLWMMALTLGVAVVREPFFATILCSFVCVAGLVAIICRHFGTQQLALVLALLIASKAFMDYTTGGLENPLSYLLIAAYCVEFSRFCDDEDRHRAPFARLVVLAALIFIARQDLVILIGPSLFWAFVAYARREGAAKALATAAISSLPAVAWCLFSLLYYGFLVPNTAFAKLSHGITLPVLLKYGVAYLLNSLRLDPITLLICATSFVVCFRRGRRAELPLALGSGAYVAYVVLIGGDFMSGRFLSCPYLISVLCLARSFDASNPAAGKRWRVSLAALLLYCVVMPYSPVRTIGRYDVSAGWWFDSWITDKRGNDSERTSVALYLRHLAGEVKFPNSPWYDDGLRFRQDDERVAVREAIGLFGYAAGPTKHIVDPLGLADPLLSRLSMCPGQTWRPGHIRREIPAGYLETLRGGRNVLDDPGLREFYDKMIVITREPIWSADRLKTIFQINTGKFGHLTREYFSRSEGRCRQQR